MKISWISTVQTIIFQSKFSPNKKFCLGKASNCHMLAINKKRCFGLSFVKPVTGIEIGEVGKSQVKVPIYNMVGAGFHTQSTNMCRKINNRIPAAAASATSFLPMCNGLTRQTWCWVNLGVNWVGDNDKAKRMSTKKNLTYSSCKLAEYISRIDLSVQKGYGSIFLGPPVTFLGCNYILQPNLRLTKNHENFLQPPEKVVVSISAGAILQSRIWIEHWTNCRILIICQWSLVLQDTCRISMSNILLKTREMLEEHEFSTVYRYHPISNHIKNKNQLFKFSQNEFTYRLIDGCKSFLLMKQLCFCCNIIPSQRHKHVFFSNPATSFNQWTLFAKLRNLKKWYLPPTYRPGPTRKNIFLK